MIVLGKRGNQKITVGQFLSALIGMFIMTSSIFLEIPYISGINVMENLCKKEHIKTIWQYIFYELNGILHAPELLIGFLGIWFWFTFLVLIIFATPGEEDKVII
jgi:hypothetical protein